MISECLHYMSPCPQPPLFIFGCLSLGGVANEKPTHFLLIASELSITISVVELPKGKHFSGHTKLYQCTNFLFFRHVVHAHIHWAAKSRDAGWHLAFLRFVHFNCCWHWIRYCPWRSLIISCWCCIHSFVHGRLSIGLVQCTCTRTCPWTCFIRLVGLHHIVQGATYIGCLTFLQLSFLSVREETTLLGRVVLHGSWFYCRKEGRNINGLLRPPNFLWFCFSSCEIVCHYFVGQSFKSYQMSHVVGGAYAENERMCVLMFTCGNLNLKLFKDIQYN